MSTIKRNIKTWVLPLAVVVGALLFFIQDRWLILNTDDFAFSTVSELVVLDNGEHVIVHDYPVTSLADAIKSQAVCYLWYNGRFVVHAIVQWFSGTQSELAFAVCNSLVFALFFVCLVTLGFGRDRRRLSLLIVAFAVVWLLMPGALRMFTSSEACSVNYLWTAAANLLLLLVFDKTRQSDRPFPRWQTALIALLALVAGSMQESFSIGIAAGLMVYLLLHWRDLPMTGRILVFAYLVGTALCVLSPANFTRSDDLGHAVRLRALVDLVKVPVFPLTVLTAAVALAIKPAVVLDVLRRNLVIIVAILVNLAFAVLVAYTMSWQLTCISILCAVLFLQMYHQLVEGKTARTVIAAVAAVAVAAIYVPMHSYRQEVWQTQHAMMDEARTSSTGIVSIKRAFDIDSRYGRSPFAPILKVYLRNEVTPLVLNDKLVAPAMLSRYLTRCGNPELVKAILPDEPAVIARAVDDGSKPSADGSKAVSFGPYTIVSWPETADAPVTDALPSQQWQYLGRHYSLYPGHIDNIP